MPRSEPGLLVMCFYMVVIEGNDPSFEAYETPAYPSMLYHRNGSTGRDRTYDQLINSQLHYRCATVE